jgi:hypothetical protein
MSQSPVSPSFEPVTLHCANVLWQVFSQRVEPFVRIIYRWTIDELRMKSTEIELQPALGETQYALIQAIYYASANSLTEDDCMTLLKLPRSTLLAARQVQCEQALQQMNLFCMKDLTTIKAVVLYIVGSMLN